MTRATLARIAELHRELAALYAEAASEPTSTEATVWTSAALPPDVSRRAFVEAARSLARGGDGRAYLVGKVWIVERSAFRPGAATSSEPAAHPAPANDTAREVPEPWTPATSLLRAGLRPSKGVRS